MERPEFVKNVVPLLVTGKDGAGAGGVCGPIRGQRGVGTGVGLFLSLERHDVRFGESRPASSVAPSIRHRVLSRQGTGYFVNKSTRLQKPRGSYRDDPRRQARVLLFPSTVRRSAYTLLWTCLR